MTIDKGRKTTRTVATLKQIFAIQGLLKEHLKENGDIWIYDGSWSDLRIADIVECSSASVSRVRKEMFGEIRVPRGNSSSSISRRVDAIEEFLRGLDMGFKD